jgi:hypothetical protein
LRGNNLTYKGITDDPNVDEHGPEIVVESCRIFQAKNENVSRYNDAVHEEHLLSEDCKFQIEFHQTEDRRKWSKAVSDHVKHLNNEKPFEAS